MSTFPFFELEQAIETHDRQLKDNGGGKPGLRDVGMLESALAQPRSGIGGHYFHKDCFEMAAAYLYHVAKNHPFVDGNKRTGVALALDFLGMLDYEIDAPPAELAELSLTIVESAWAPELAKYELAKYFRKKARKLTDYEL